MLIKRKKDSFSPVNGFDIQITYSEIYRNFEGNQFDSHVHEECEIYINLSGDVSFMVENRIYPVSPGSIVISRPFEYHHCIYHSEKLHKHFWILFSAAGNENLFDVFYNRKAGENNLLSLSPEDTEELISLCHEMTDGSADEVEKYYRFFKLITLLQSAESINANGIYPADVLFAINYISKNLSQPISVSQLARCANVSVNTLERHFLQVLNCSPIAYIRKKRLAHAAKLLAHGCTVTEASESSGFSDYSAFIALFKKYYGITPLKYKISLLK